MPRTTSHRVSSQVRKRLKHASRRYRRLLVEQLASREMMAGDVSVVDLNTLPLLGVTQSTFNGAVEVSGKLYYRDSDPVYGTELYEFDPATNARQRVTDWNPGLADSLASYVNYPLIGKSGSKLFLSVYTDQAGQEVGVYDAVTQTSTFLDITPGKTGTFPYTADLSPGISATVGSRFYFMAGGLRWIDTSAASLTVNTLNAPGHNAFQEMTPYGTRLYFASQTSGAQKLRWIDTTLANPTVNTIEVPNASSSLFVRSLRVVGNKLYFLADENINGTELRWIDLTLANPTVNTINFAPGLSSSNPREMTVIGDKLFFASTRASDGMELRWIDAVNAPGTIQTLDVELGANSSNAQFLTPVGSRLFFWAYTAALGSEIRWIDTASASPVVETIDSNPGVGNTIYDRLFGLSTQLVAIGSESATGKEPRVFDALSATPTMRIVDVNPGFASSDPSSLVGIGDRLYFNGEIALAGRNMVWFDAALSTPTIQYVDVRDTASSSAKYFFPADDKIFFAGVPGYNFSENRIGWIENRTLTPQAHYLDILTDPNSFNNPGFKRIGNKLFFIGKDDTSGAEVRWIDLSDPSLAIHTFDVAPGATGSSPSYLTVVGSRLVYSAYETTNGWELRWVDASEASPSVQTIDLIPGSSGTNPRSMTTVGDQLYFVAFDLVNGEELRRVDFSNSGATVSTYDLNPGATGSFLGYDFAVIGDRFFFVAYDPIQSTQIRWISTTPGDNTIRTIAFAGLSEQSWFAVSGNRLYFEARDAARGKELRWFDGTLDTPVLTSFDLNVGPNSTDFKFQPLVPAGNKLFFVAESPSFETELRWVDTTSASTIIRTIDLSTISSNPSELTLIGNRLFLNATDTYLGQEMYWLDVTQANPVATLVDLSGGASISNPRGFVGIGNRVYFSGFKLGSKDETYIYSDATPPANLMLSGLTVLENEPVGTLVGSFSTEDSNVVESFTYTLVPGDGDSGNSFFEITNNELRTLASFDFETQGPFSIRVRTTDIDGLSFEKNFTIQISDVDESIVIDGTSGDDAFEVSLVGPQSDQWLIKRNGIEVYAGPSSTLFPLQIFGFEGTDSLRVNGTAGNDTLSANAGVWQFNGRAIVADSIATFSAFGDLGDDVLTLDAVLPVAWDAGLGNDRIEGPDLANAWEVQGSNRGALNLIATFQNTESIRGGSDADQFVFTSLGILIGSVDGGDGIDTLDQSAKTRGITVNAQTKTATNTGGWLGIENWRGSAAAVNDAFIGRDANSNYLVSGLDHVVINTTEFDLTNFENVTGGILDDAFLFADSTSKVRGTLNGGTGLDSVSWSNWPSPIQFDLATLKSEGAALFRNFESFEGTPWNDLFIGANTTNTWQITDLDQGLIGTRSFKSFERLRGGTGNDSFRFIGSAARVSTFIQGGLGVDSVVGPNVVNSWEVSGTGAGSLGGTSFSEIENLTGGTVSDAFVMMNEQAAVPGTLNGGGGTDSLSWATWTIPIQVNVALSQATAIGRFQSVESFEGGQNSDSFRGPDTNSSWQVNGWNQGLLGATVFRSFESIQGGNLNDSFRFVGAAARLTNGLSAGLGIDTLTGPEAPSRFLVDGSGSGELNQSLFGEIENLTGGGLDDEFIVGPFGSLAGNLNGGRGVNALSYEAWSVPVSINMTAGLMGNATAITGITSSISILIGGASDDTLIGNSSLTNVILGNGGSDFIQGGAARDLLFGGVGADTLRAGGGDDLLIAGSTSHDGNFASLRLLRSEWTTTSRSFAQRVANLNGTGTGTRSNGNIFLDVSTVFSDSEVDSLWGEGNSDWFWAMAAEAADVFAADLRYDG